MICYFCQSEVKDSFPKQDPIHWMCHQCMDDNNLIKVLMTKDSYAPNKDHVIYIHIFTDKFHVRLHMDENITNICQYIEGEGDKRNIVTLPGFPINPSNVHKKLGIYLTFL